MIWKTWKRDLDKFRSLKIPTFDKKLTFLSEKKKENFPIDDRWGHMFWDIVNTLLLSCLTSLGLFFSCSFPAIGADLVVISTVLCEHSVSLLLVPWQRLPLSRTCSPYPMVTLVFFFYYLWYDCPLFDQLWSSISYGLTRYISCNWDRKYMRFLIKYVRIATRSHTAGTQHFLIFLWSRQLQANIR